MCDTKKKDNWILIVIVVLILSFLFFNYIVIGYLKGKADKDVMFCGDNLILISKQLQNYAKSNNNRFPPSLSKLSPQYLKTTPTCPAAKKDVYSEGYEVSADFKTFTLYCKGHYHKNVAADANYPRYYSNHGLVRFQYLEPTPTVKPSNSPNP